ncbi:MAG TPA: LamG-like jellyroll fold domain-containing protein [Chthoniobacteraceae bacterium]|nr:LamG-like jellyroll fold domain-containing protein [Chthoniobacteraceae bacterium]
MRRWISRFRLACFSLLIAIAPRCGIAADDHRVFELPFTGGSLDASLHNGPGKPIHQARVTPAEGPGGRPAVSIPVEGQLIYEGSGNFFIPAGTLSFWWRADAPPLRVETDLLSLSSLQRFYFSRWLRLVTRGGRIAVTLYHGNSAEVFDDEGAVPSTARPRKRIRHELAAKEKIVAGQWYHVAVTWDMARGVALYIDGELAREVNIPWYYAGNANHISLGCRSSSYSKAATARFPQSFAALTTFDCWLEPDEIARLAQGQPVTPKADLAPMLEERALRMGLTAETPLPEAPLSAAEGDALYLTQIGVPVAHDVLRRSYAALDGDPGRAWPMYQGYSNSGQTLRITPVANPPLTTVQALGSGRMRFEALTAEGKREPLLDLEASAATLVGATRAAPLPVKQVEVHREDGVLFHVALLNAARHPFPVDGKEGWNFHPLAPGKPEQQPLVGLEFAPEDRTLLAAAPAPVSGSGLALPARRAIHLLGPAAPRQQGIGAVALDLAVRNAPEKTEVAVMVIDPTNYERRTFYANARFVREGKTADGKARLVVDLRNLVYPQGGSPWIVLYLSEALQIDLAASRLGLQNVSLMAAKREFVPDQLALVQDDFQERSEGRPWGHDPGKIKLLGTLLRRIDLLRELSPGDPLIEGYWHWTHPKEAPPLVSLPKVPAAIPPWAFYTHQSIGLFRDAAHWWIDNRQSETGEFGAPDGINDDTDLIQDWLAIDLMHGPDEKIRHAVDKVADISWRLKTIDGISKQITDTLHIYEWGINAQTLAFVLRYGDPVYYTRLLRFASHYPELMSEACEGRHLHFKSWYFGASRIVTEGVYARDIQLNALLLQPAMLLAWYNGDEEATRVLTRWSASMRDHVEAQAGKTRRVPGASVEMPSGKTRAEDHFGTAYTSALWASYELTGDKSYLDFIGSMINYEITRPPLFHTLRTSSVAPSYLAATGDDRWDAYWEEKAGDPELWRRSIHNSNYRELNAFFATWIRSGDDDWLNLGSRLSLYHMIWSLPMLTEAEATTDRVWLPQSLANQITLGDHTILRNRVYPRHVVSWENATGAFTPLVRSHAPDHLKVEIWNLEEKPVSVQARLWRLNAGEYELTLTPRLWKADQPGAPVRSKASLERYSAVPVDLPAGSVVTLEARLIGAADDIRQRSDLAISPLDARYLPEKKVVQGNVYNIGSRESGEFEVVATGPDGKPVYQKTFRSLPPPKNFETARHPVEIPVADPDQPLTITLRGNGKEITLFNNRVTLTPARQQGPIE